MEKEELTDKLEQIRQMLTVAYSGQKTDDSWMRPVLATKNERRINLHTAISYLDNLMVEISEGKMVDASANTLPIQNVINL